MEKRLTPSSSTSKHLTSDSKINNNEITYTEIRWVLKTLVSRFSVSLVDDVCDTFQKILPDSAVAKSNLHC